MKSSDLNENKKRAKFLEFSRQFEARQKKRDKSGKMASQSTMADFSQADKDKLITDVVFYILSQEQKRPIFKRSEIMKAIGLTGRNAGIQEEIWKESKRELLETFGYEMATTSDKKGT